ncbi:MAG: aminotransferase class V-fold PLP-dependent enzyme [Planctomycetes bacterium]|nr:aminotransferase class V-fold PLP-dependent enzyme [Planctomycetota bacterium]
MILDPSIINLNTGSFGPLPRPVFEKVTAMREVLASEPTDYFIRKMPPLLWEARCKLADFLGTKPQRLVFAINVSTAINLVAAGLRLNSPGEILLTDHEYTSMQWCWERSAIRQGLSIKTFKLPTMARSSAEIVEAAVAAMTPRTRLFFFSHVLSPTGLVLPAKELCAEARKRGILTAIDGAHAVAMRPLDVSDVGADFYTGNCHKWLLAPTNSGFLVIGPGNEDRLQPLQVSWGYHPHPKPMDEPDEFGSTPRVRHLEFEGTRDPCPWLITPDAIAFQADLGWEAIRGRIAELAAYVRKRLGAIAGLTLATPAEPGLHGALTAFQLPFTGPEKAAKLREAIWKHRIEVPVVERPDRLLLRVSTHFYNTEEEVDRLAEVLPGVLKGM